MVVVMKRSIVEGARALDAGKLYDLLDAYARRLIREGHAELPPSTGGKIQRRQGGREDQD